MEGIIDQYMRAILTDVGGFTSCVTEFIRVVDKLHPETVFYRYCPELYNNGVTPSGVPVVVQLLGGVPEVVAVNAQRAAELGAHGIDINFGCPSRFVNRKAGGAVLLKEPNRIYDIVKATRDAVPSHVPVSAKIRLGYEDTALALDNAHAVENGGANFVTVHARTKSDGYKAPARWKWLTKINDTLSIPVIANGDIMSRQDYLDCYEMTGCTDIMIGRGAIRRPDLALQIQSPNTPVLTWQQIHLLFDKMYRQLKLQQDYTQQKILGRLKQWLFHLKLAYQEAEEAFNQVRLLKDLQSLERWITNPKD